MRSLFIAAALTVGAALGSADTARAQYYGYNYSRTVDPVTGNVVTNRTTANGLTTQTTTGVYNPWLGYGTTTFGYSDVFGNRLATTTPNNWMWNNGGYSPWMWNNTAAANANPYTFNPYMMYTTGVPNAVPYLTGGNLSMYNYGQMNAARYNQYMMNMYRARGWIR
jgi:hypothetical protein